MGKLSWVVGICPFNVAATDKRYSLGVSRTSQMLRFTQPIPVVTPQDVERVVGRDFKPEERLPATQELTRCTLAGNTQVQARVQLAVLKLAAGDLERLRMSVEVALADFRDVIAPAEYPRCLRADSLSSLSWLARSRIYSADWKEYKAWLAH